MLYKTLSAAVYAGLTALQSLRLQGTQVSDLTPLAGLAALQSLDLDSTQASDLTPLAGLTALQSLNLYSTQVSDLAPLNVLASLKFIAVGRDDKVIATLKRPARYDGYRYIIE